MVKFLLLQLCLALALEVSPALACVSLDGSEPPPPIPIDDYIRQADVALLDAELTADNTSVNHNEEMFDYLRRGDPVEIIVGFKEEVSGQRLYRILFNARLVSLEKPNRETKNARVNLAVPKGNLSEFKSDLRLAKKLGYSLTIMLQLPPDCVGMRNPGQ